MAAFTGTNPFQQQSPIPGVKNIVAVGAGKGGVGKSTVASNLAVALQKSGKKVGILDADIYGPSVPRMFGLAHLQPNVNGERKIEPLISQNVKTMSMGYLVDPNSAIIWRGPMLFKAIEQFLRDVAWGELDFLIVDLPPGTGDVQLTLAQKVPVSGAIVVSTPQDVALLDVRRCIDMFEKVKTPVVGLIENMAAFVCPHCHEATELFPPGHLHQFCEEKKIPILARVPFNPKIGVASESGHPYLADDSESAEGKAFLQAAQKLIELTQK